MYSKMEAVVSIHYSTPKMNRGKNILLIYVTVGFNKSDVYIF